MKQNLPYIISDLDGTIANRDFKVNNDTIVNINKYQEKSNYKFTFITGRTYTMCLETIDLLNIKQPIGICNAAVIMNPITKEILYENLMTNDLVLKIARESINNNFKFSLYTIWRVIGIKNESRNKKWTEFNKKANEKFQVDIVNYDNTTDLIKAVEDEKFNVVKIVYDVEDENQEIKINEMISSYDELVLNKGGSDIVDCMMKGPTKEHGVKFLADYWKIDYQSVYVFGDNENDIEMLCEQKNSFAVGNAVHNAKMVATEVIDTMENDGVGKKLLEIIAKSEN